MFEPPRVPFLVLDLDGTVRQSVNELGHFVNGPGDVVLFPEAVAMMLQWKHAGGRIVGASNQGGVALGLVSAEAVMQAVAETNRQARMLFDGILVCPHHPSAALPAMRRCFCRKPLPGVAYSVIAAVEQATGEVADPERSLFVGDMESDRQCAAAMGMDFMWASEWRSVGAHLLEKFGGADGLDE